MLQDKRLLIIGAGSGQLPIILKAVELGCYVITVDNIPDNIGHQYSHQRVNCSTVDHENVLKHARELNIDGIVTFASDIATATVAFVAEQLQLPSCTLQLARTMSNKANFRAFQKEHQLDHPAFLVSQCHDEFIKQLQDLCLPLIFKPVDTSGSRGITKVADLDVANCRNAFLYAQSFSSSGSVSVESFIEGVDVSGDGFLIDGQLSAIITQKYKQGFIPTGHSLPTHISDADQKSILEEVTKTCLALNYRNGPVDFDIIIADSGIVVVEISPRLGGNGIPKLIQRGTGIDLVAMTVKYALSVKNKTSAIQLPYRRCGSRIFGSDIAGRIDALAPASEVYIQVPELFDYHLNYQKGDLVPKFEHSGNSLGYALFDCPAGFEYADIVNKIQVAMHLQISATV